MILGCGIDLIEVARFERERVRRCPENHQGLWRDFDCFDDVLTPSEIKRCQQTRRPIAKYAAAFAAKEACFKALGTGKTGAMSWHDIEIGRDERHDTVRLAGETAAVAHARGVDEIYLSLTSTRELVVAYVVMCARLRP